MDKPAAVGKDVLTCFYLAMATRTLGVLCREKALSELPNGSMVKNGSSRPGTQDDRLANKRKPAPTFSIGGLEILMMIILLPMHKSTSTMYARPNVG